MTRHTNKTVILLHGWLGGPRSFGDLAALLSADGHRVLPVFEKYDTWKRSLTIEQIADRLQTQFERVASDLDRPMVIIAHSMGGLLARSWILRHYIEKDRSQPIETLIECGSPRHGVPGNGLGRFLIRCRLLPGNELVRQMQASSSFLWELNRAESETAESWPTIAALTSVSDSGSYLSFLIGCAESDGIVPAVASAPNPVFVSPGSPARRTTNRVFRVFPGWRHEGGRGLLGHLRADPDGKPLAPDDTVWRTLRELVRTGEIPPDTRRAPDTRVSLARSFILIRTSDKKTHAPLPEIHLDGIPAGGAATAVLQPKPYLENGQLFYEHSLQGPERFSVRRGEEVWTDEALGLPKGLEPGEVCYVDLK